VVVRLRHSDIDEHDGRAHPELEPRGVLEVAQRRVVHEEHRIRESLDAGLQAKDAAAML
jgi:hypothetical protein